MYDDVYWEFHDELTWRLIKPHLPRDLSARCLDLGCGTGKWGLRLLKTGWSVTFVDQSAAMIEQTRRNREALGLKSQRAELVCADMLDLSSLGEGGFSLILAMGDPLSICGDAQRAVRQMNRVCAAGGIVIATADNKLAALDHLAQAGDLEGLQRLVHTGKTNWLTGDRNEQFELTTMTPSELGKIFARVGFEVLDITGKTILPLRKNPGLLQKPEAMQQLLRLEAELAKDPAAAGRAAHLQITARKNG